MLSENRLEKRMIGVDSQTYKDYQDTSDNDTLYNIIKLGLMAGTGYALFKSGALKDVMKPMLELADNIAREGTDRAAMTMSTIKQWSELKHLTPAQLANSKKQTKSAPLVSLFREKDSSIFYDLYEDLSGVSNDRLTNFHNVRTLMNGTKEDLNILFEMIQENQKNLKIFVLIIQKLICIIV